MFNYMKEIMNDLKTVITNDIKLFVLIIAVNGLTIYYTEGWVEAILTYSIALFSAHWINQTYLGQELTTPNVRSRGYLGILALYSVIIAFIGFIYGITFAVDYLFTVDKTIEQAKDTSTYWYHYLFALILIVLYGNGLMLLSCCHSIANLKDVTVINIFDTVSYASDCNTKLWWTLALLSSLSFIFIGLYASIIFQYLGCCYTMRYILRLPPTKKQRIKQTKLVTVEDH